MASARHDGEPLCIAILDLDHFKAYNDANGHPAGDALLAGAAVSWRRELRPTDILARYGGEEFAAVLPACSLDGAQVVVERIRAATPAGQTVSAGIAAVGRRARTTRRSSRAPTRPSTRPRPPGATARWPLPPSQRTRGGYGPSMGQFHWDPDRYLKMVRAEVPDYDRVQDELARATDGIDARRALELGTGSGVTSRRVLERHPHAQLTGVDSSEHMLAAADLPGADLRLQDLRDPLPEGPFDLVFSALAIHHLDGPSKADLFARVAAVLAPGGRFAMADVVVPEDPADVVTPLDDGFDLPETVPDLLRWLDDAGLRARVSWQARDLAVLVADAAVSSTSAGQTATS